MIRTLKYAIILVAGLQMHFADAATINEQFDAAMNAEHVLGDIPKALELFEAVIAQEPKESSILSQALFRLANCQWKLNRHYDAIQTLDELREQGGDSRYHTESENLRNKIINQPLNLLPTPWQDGERLEYTEFFNENRPVSQTTVIYKSRESNKGKAWQIASTMVNLNNHARFYRRSEVLDENASLQTAHLQVLKQAPFVLTHDAQKQTTLLTGPNNVSESVRQPAAVQFEVVLEELQRRIHLDEGQQRFFTLYSHTALEHIGIAIERLPGSELISTEAGDFNTHRYRKSVIQNGSVTFEQNYWVSDNSRRLIVKQDINQTEVRLQSVSDDAGTTPTKFTSEDHSFSVKVPTGWRMYEKYTGDIYKFEALIYPLDNQDIYGYGFSSYIELEALNGSLKTAVDMNVDWHDKNAKNISKYTVDEKDIREFKVDGHDALTYLASYVDNGRPTLEYRFLVLSKSAIYQFFISGPPKDIQGYIPTMDEMIQSIHNIKPNLMESEKPRETEL